MTLTFCSLSCFYVFVIVTDWKHLSVTSISFFSLYPTLVFAFFLQISNHSVTSWEHIGLKKRVFTGHCLFTFSANAYPILPRFG